MDEQKQMLLAASGQKLVEEAMAVGCPTVTLFISQAQAFINLLSWRGREADAAREEIARLKAELDLMRRDIRELVEEREG